jgi:hypothetical protein
MLALTIATTVRIGVFGLFHPVALDVKPAGGQVLVIESHGLKQILEGSTSARLQSPALVTGRDGGEAAFILSVPGRAASPRIQREFHGRLEIRKVDGHLIALVQMDREMAVASIVAAEGSEAVPFEARKAQAVVARSFLAASRGRHQDFDFCDTTHCQFLREPPGDKSLALRAAADTRGQVLTYQGAVVAALYSADCGGHTRALADSGWRDAESYDSYPYFAVQCPVLGAVSGHRIGLCQVGAAEMARHGATFREILRHYFPATSIADPGPVAP